MKKSGWKALLGGKCLFILKEEINGKTEIVGLAGLHVNDLQTLRFPCWPGVPIEDLAVITWADASNHNRPDRSSTVGILTGIAPKDIMNGEEARLP
jgi:hypothetical protein